MAKSSQRAVRSVLGSFATLLALCGLAPHARAASGTFGVQGIYALECDVYPMVFCSPFPLQTGIPLAPAFSLDRHYHGENSFNGIATTADVQLTIDAAADAIRVKANTAGTFAQDPVRGLEQHVSSSYATLVLDTMDVIHFNASTLDPGSSVAFEVTEVLDSTVSGVCVAGSEPGARVSYYIVGLPVLSHTTCGHGSDHLWATGSFTAQVGAAVPLMGNLQMGVFSGFGSGNAQGLATASDQHGVDASSTAAVYIRVLTPGVTFSSDSGAIYQPVPEPGSASLWAGGALLLAGVRRWRRRPRS